ncbi:PQQ-dependent sugar dehydrogenase [Noviherbaspirillum sp. L7-7A]|uniref:PQQ-dependent sugar dehydrogenase n=1 Tax=Noviherbaspirillum sp. L7-7A TaxID=2850560 RepID=UPI001C2B7EE4|nr:PQQ-dependent sugar dehydrogenase [Noviherbaspirillum sp. L7-7A]MBV0881534.1 PQQ-dependent sugar dehydrogenase [Noviherbaspirillum sp. L7-7A]
MNRVADVAIIAMWRLFLGHPELAMKPWIKHIFKLPVCLAGMLAGCGGSGGDGTSPATGSAGLSSEPAGQPATAFIPPSADAAPALAAKAVASGLSSPVFLTAPDGDTRLFIVERGGSIRIVQDGGLLPMPFLDIRGRTTTDGERGLLSMAFDPAYAENGFFYVYYTDLNGDIAIDRYRVSANPAQADSLSALRILSIPHPQFSNHNGGLLRFGPDGYLYVGTGDGGSQGDPFANAQNTGVLLGKLLRIDVSATSAGTLYAIPATNPFLNQPGKRAEIWAYGLRNPWRYAFDASTSLLYIADVGQNKREEIDIAPTEQGGLNYGWNVMEGEVCFTGDACDSRGLTLPALEYGRDGGACAIVGGFVYRGAAIPGLQGVYLYSDLCAGWIKGLRYANGTTAAGMDFGRLASGAILSFGEDAQHELYLLTVEGNVYRIVAR